jgi:hypothetical protein
MLGAMDAEELVGLVLVAGFVLFMVGAGAWRLAYDRPLVEALHAIHPDRRRRAWIHVWMIVAMLVTPAGLAAWIVVVDDPVVRALLAVGATVYALGAVCWIVNLAFRLAVVPWAAEHTVETGRPPEGFPALDRWAGTLYLVHMTSAYAAFAVLGAAALAAGTLPSWLGWLGVVWGPVFLFGFVATRFEGPFNPPAWAHLYTAIVGVVLLTG